MEHVNYPATTTIPGAPAALVLVVDDDPDMQKLLARAIHRAGHQPECCGDGVEGMRRFNAMAPSMVLLDLMLPNISGFELCRQMRASGSRVPIVAVSTRNLPEDEAHAMAAGFDLFISKPIRVDDVSSHVRRLLDNTVNPSPDAA